MSVDNFYKWPTATLAMPFLMLFSLGGCGDEKSGLTESELKRIAIGEKIKLVEGSGGLVLTVGGETITSDQIIKSSVQSSDETVSLADSLKSVAQESTLEQFKERAKLRVQDVLMREVSNILLYQYAKREAGDNIDEALDKAAEKELRRFVLSFGGNEAKADEALSEMGMDRKKFKENQKKFLLTQSFLASKMPRDRPITYAELLDAYNQMKDKSFFRPGMLKFRLIDIEPAKLQIADPNQDPLRQAREMADGLIGRIKAGEDFGKLAEQYSHDHMREFGGLWKPVRPDSLAEPYDILAREAEKTEPGQIAGPIEVPGHIFIMRLEEKQAQGYEPFEKVQRQVESEVIYGRQNEILTRIKARLLEQAALGETGQFVDFCLEKIYRPSKQ